MDTYHISKHKWKPLPAMQNKESQRRENGFISSKNSYTIQPKKLRKITVPLNLEKNQAYSESAIRHKI